MKDLASLHLLLVWAVFFVGVVAADQFVISNQVYLLGLLVSLFGVVWWKSRRGGGVATAAPGLGLALSLASILFLAGVIRMEYAETQFNDSLLQEQLGSAVTLTGTVVHEPDVRESFTQLYVDVGDERVLVRTDRFSSVQYGDEVTVIGRLDQPEAFETDTGRIFDYPNYLKVRGVQYVVSFADVAVESSDNGNSLLAGLYAAKDRFAAAVTASLPPPQSDLGLGLLLGIKQALGDDLEDAFRRTGLIHIVVLSGYNVMLVIGFMWWVTSWFLPLQGRVIASFIGIVLFALLVGLSATVVRASIMASILLLAKWIGTRYDVLRALLFAGFVMVLINPYVLLYDLGFQLSFMATLGLVLFLPQFESTVATDTTNLGLRDIFLATTITQIFVLPLLMYSIGEVSLISIVANMLVLPVVAFAMLGTFVTGMVGLVSQTLALPFAFITNLLLSYIITVVTWFNQLSWAAVIVPVITLWQTGMLYALIGVVWWGWRKNTLKPKINKDTKPDATAPGSDTPAFLR